jgi:hypothetical protein
MRAALDEAEGAPSANDHPPQVAARRVTMSWCVALAHQDESLRAFAWAARAGADL